VPRRLKRWSLPSPRRVGEAVAFQADVITPDDVTAMVGWTLTSRGHAIEVVATELGVASVPVDDIYQPAR
jgi:hypothetical protein